MSFLFIFAKEIAIKAEKNHLQTFLFPRILIIRNPATVDTFFRVPSCAPANNKSLCAVLMMGFETANKQHPRIAQN